MTVEQMREIYDRLQAALPKEGVQLGEKGDLQVTPVALVAVLTYLRDQEGFDYLSNLSGVDWIEQGEFEVVYHLFAMRRGERLTYGEDPGGPLGPVVVKVRVPRAQPVVPSAGTVWVGALWQERETYDMLGIRFEGHPDLRRIYLWDEYEDHPLRKDFVAEEG
jgi:NADH:ubiquinone oxidoreductase subunit C